MMKKIITLALFAALALTAASAQNPGAYFMENSAHRLQLNPAFAPERGYFNIPVAGSLHSGLGGNISVGNIFYPYNGKLVSLLDSHIPVAQALDGLSAKNNLALDFRTGILSFGAFTRNQRSFWSFDLNARAEIEANVPKSLVEFAKRGGDHLVANNIGASFQLYAEAGFSYSFRVMDGLYLGARGKFISGIARGRVAIDRFEVIANDEMWMVEGTGSLEASGLVLKPGRRQDGSQYYDLDSFGDSDIEMPAGYGFGIDLGATYDVMEDLQVSLAVNDLGFIAWDEDRTSRGQMKKHAIFEGVEIADGQATTISDFDFGALEFDKQRMAGGTRSLHTSINAGAEYKLWERRVGLGLLYNVKFWDERAYNNITASATFTPINWFTLGTSYSFLNNRGHSLGLAVNFSPSWINFFVATDMLLGKRTPQCLPVNSSSANITLGLGFPIGKKNERRMAKF